MTKIKTKTTKQKTTKLYRRMINTPNAEIHIRESTDGKPSRTITGYAIVFGVESNPLWQDGDSVAREVISPSAITQDLLDNSDIKFTMFHDRQLILARSNMGQGTLSYQIDKKGVSFSFEAPNTVDGDKALELVHRGDLTGCSFMFTTYYSDTDFVQRSSEVVNGVAMITYTVNAVTGVYDMTLAADPAYPDTTVLAETRELITQLREQKEKPKKPEDTLPDPAQIERENKIKAQIADMRKQANFDF